MSKPPQSEQSTQSTLKKKAAPVSPDSKPGTTEFRALRTHWTQSRHPQVENEIQQLVFGMQHKIQCHFSPQDYKGVAVTGGYGRGEGGVRYQGGRATANNNIDLIWVVPNGKEIGTLQSRFKQQVAAPLSRSYGIDIDAYFIHEKHLRRLPCLVMLYDIKFGHRVIAGHPDVLTENIAYTVEDILPSDMRNLMVNRATLLLLNQWLLQQFQRQQPHSAEVPQALFDRVIKHTTKAIIGYGDALLFSQGDYHWSYTEKERLMGVQVNLPVTLRSLYSQAIRYRFDPVDFDLQGLGILQRSPEALAQWQQALLQFFSQWHLAYENWRMQSDSKDWNNYAERTLCHAFSAENSHRGVVLRKVKHFVRNQSPSQCVSWKARLGLKVSEPASALSAIFPFVAYTHRRPHFVNEQLLLKPGAAAESVLARYLQCWGSYLDPSLISKMREWEICAQ